MHLWSRQIPFELIFVGSSCQMDWIGNLDLALDIFFFVDVLVNFNTAFQNDRGFMVLDHRIIALRYLRWVGEPGQIIFAIYLPENPFQDLVFVRRAFQPSIGSYPLLIWFQDRLPFTHRQVSPPGQDGQVGALQLISPPLVSPHHTLPIPPTFPLSSLSRLLRPPLSVSSSFLPHVPFSTPHIFFSLSLSDLCRFIFISPHSLRHCRQ